MADKIALAGVLHSVYSTNVYRTPIIPWERIQNTQVLATEVACRTDKKRD
jgi:hypothetical protein